MKKTTLLCLSILLSAFACQKAPEQPKRFALLSAEETGIDFKNSLKPTKGFNILEYLYYYNGGGVSAGDINNDGLVDLYFTANQGPNKLYLNKGNFQFEDITEKAGVAGTGTWSSGVTMADVNGDGFLDIYVSNVGNYKEAQGKNELFINNQDGTFTESAADYGLDFEGFATQAAFFDYDRDGDLDVYLLNHSVKNPEVFSKADSREKSFESGDKLMQSQLAQGENAFVDVTERSGIYSSLIGFGLGLGISDVNNDGWPDIYISNDFTENDYLYINQQDGTFKDDLQHRIRHTSRFSMGNELADLNNDGSPEIVTTDMLPSDPEIWRKSVVEDKSEVYDIKLGFGYNHQYVRNTLQRNLGNGQFSDVSLYTNTYASDWSWSPLIFDMDNDGFQDLHITNGIYKRPNDLDFLNYLSNVDKTLSQEERDAFLIETLPTVKIANLTARNTGRFNLEPMAEEWGLDQPSYSNGSAYADLDNDGDLDLIINNTEQEAFIYENKSTDNNYLKIALKGDGLNTMALGAKVVAKSQGQTFIRENNPTRGFQSSVAPMLHFGLGSVQTLSSVEVYWPNGTYQKLENVKANQLLEITQNTTATKAFNLSASNRELLTNTTFPMAYSHQEDAYSDFKQEYLIPRKYNTEGPALAVADINGDGLDDAYFGGARGQAGEVWLQNANGTFSKQKVPTMEQLSISEDVAATFFDANGDGNMDLYVTSAGNEHKDGYLYNNDKLFLNFNGKLTFSPMSLPQLGSQAKTVSAADVDGDGDIDLFVGSNVVNGAYGTNPNQYLLINDGKGRFRDESANRFPKDLGMINDSKWYDYDNDGDLDLLIAGEWTSIMLLENDGTGNFERVETESLKNTSGWWYSLHLADVNNDGKMDIVAGNLGLNTKLKASAEAPLKLYVSDVDKNGQVDPVIFHHQEGELTPFATRDDLIKQVSAFKKKHPDYKTYSKLEGPQELLGESMERAVEKEAVTFESAVFLNKGNGEFEQIALPQEAQYSPVMDIISNDFDGDGTLDLLLFGNNYSYRNDYGRADAKPITLLLGKGDGHFSSTVDAYLNTAETWGEYRHAQSIEVNGVKHVIAVRNNDKPILLAPNSN
ncbi:VCBS repeat-containing protein [Roseivirga pacifica]|uniref:VCBS repeat-containing protein n=1 Tax=Roseivirga pacifica TaxID=1267423 RepID=UPI00227B786E|nr:VCBS repeat-containing protein [Roseivirga pacifica]